jgi:hypothetical protein
MIAVQFISVPPFALPALSVRAGRLVALVVHPNDQG